jgi:hypothetical protein
VDAWPCPVRRILDRQAAVAPPADARPGWNAPTSDLQRVAPLLTLGQAARSRQAGPG